MPKHSETFIIKAPLEKCWTFVSDLKNLGSCMPGFINLEVVDEKTQIWTMIAEVMRQKREEKFKGFINELKPYDAKFAVEGITERLKGQGSAHLEAISPTETKVSFDLDVEATGLLKSIINPAIKGTVEKMGKGFAENLAAVMEGRPKPK